jgi:hypothetical protein
MAVQLQWVTVATVQLMVGWPRNRDGQRWQQWATAGVTVGDGDSDGTIPTGINGGGAIDGRTAATAQWQSHGWRWQQWEMAMAVAR